MLFILSLGELHRGEGILGCCYTEDIPKLLYVTIDEGLAAVTQLLCIGAELIALHRLRGMQVRAKSSFQAGS